MEEDTTDTKMETETNENEQSYQFISKSQLIKEQVRF